MQEQITASDIEKALARLSYWKNLPDFARENAKIFPPHTRVRIRNIETGEVVTWGSDGLIYIATWKVENMQMVDSKIGGYSSEDLQVIEYQKGWSQSEILAYEEAPWVYEKEDKI